LRLLALLRWSERRLGQVHRPQELLPRQLWLARLFVAALLLDDVFAQLAFFGEKAPVDYLEAFVILGFGHGFLLRRDGDETTTLL
jgi:hypothetical protein